MDPLRSNAFVVHHLDSRAPPAHERRESRVVFCIIGTGEVFCRISALICHMLRVHGTSREFMFIRSIFSEICASGGGELVCRIFSCMRSRPRMARAHQSIAARRQRGASVEHSRSNCRAAATRLDGEAPSGRTCASCASCNGGAPEPAVLLVYIGDLCRSL